MCPKRIFIIGGTFNPPHLGHVKVVSEIDRRYRPDLILLIPTGLPPHKRLPADAAKAEDRFAMLSLCMPRQKNIQISDLEIKRQGKSYTLDTINELKEQYPDSRFFLVIGSDMLLSLETWHEFEKILKSCTIIAVSRKSGMEHKMEDYAQKLKDSYGAVIERMDMEPFEVSSSHIRDMVKEGMDTSSFIDQNVKEYIDKNGLYSGEPNNK
jgi:nicotinate-nucleotide adenylyltransferase